MNFKNNFFMSRIKIFLITLLSVLSLSGLSQAQPVKSIGVTEPVTISGHVLRKMVTGLTDIKLKKMPTLVTAVDGVEIGSTGYYTFSGLTPGFYKLFINGVEKQEYGVTQIATYIDTLGTWGMGGNLDFNGNKIIDLGNATTGTDALNRNTADSRYLTLGSLSSQLVLGSITFSNVPPSTIISPTHDGHLTNKNYVDSLVANVVVTPTQFPATIRRVIAGGTVLAGRDYLTISTAESSISGASASSRYRIFLEEGTNNTDVSPDEDNIFYADHNDMQNFVSLIGYGMATKLVIGINGSSFTSSGITIENCAVYLGENDITANRSYNGISFYNCTIYAYRGTTFNNVNMSNCNIVHATTYTATLTGSGTYSNCTFSGNVVLSAFSGTMPNTIDGYDLSPSMPPDLSLAP